MINQRKASSTYMTFIRNNYLLLQQLSLGPEQLHSDCNLLMTCVFH